VVEWRYCGRFVYKSQNAYPDPDLSWIDEDEARRRYHDPSKRLTVVAPVDEATGIVPWYIAVTTGEFPSFTVTHQQLPGVPLSQTWWKNLGDGRLFGDQADIWSYPPAEEMLYRSQGLALVHATVFNNEDGTGRLSMREKGNPVETTADRRFDPAPLYLPVPEWGQWEELAHAELPGK
jgi:hypothetical protein